MTRKQFLKTCGTLGLGLPFATFAYGRSKLSSSEKVIIIGAGAAGLSVAYLLQQQGVEYTILEGSNAHGGRMKINESFSDFPIALGAEWISTTHIDFAPLIDSKKVMQKIKTVNYLPTDAYWLKSGDKLLRGTLNNFNDKKFVNSSWFDFFTDLILPYVNKNIKYEAKVQAIDYNHDIISIKCKNEVYKANKVIITAPLPLLKDIDFSPSLPSKKLEAMRQANYWNGFKAFFEFETKFYPAFVDYLIQPETDGQVSLYDAAWGQKSDKNILGLFSVGRPADNYGSMSEDAFRQHILKELDEIFEGQASQNYIKHIVQNWEDEPFAKGAYVSDHTEPKIIYKLQEPIDSKIYLAGDAYTDGRDWGNVHNAIHSAKQCVDSLIKEL